MNSRRIETIDAMICVVPEQYHYNLLRDIGARLAAILEAQRDEESVQEAPFYAPMIRERQCNLF